MREFASIFILIALAVLVSRCSKTDASPNPQPSEPHTHDIKVECLPSFVNPYESRPCACKENEAVVSLVGTRSCMCAEIVSECQVCIDGVCIPPQVP